MQQFTTEQVWKSTIQRSPGGIPRLRCHKIRHKQSRSKPATQVFTEVWLPIEDVGFACFGEFDFAAESWAGKCDGPGHTAILAGIL